MAVPTQLQTPRQSSSCTMPIPSRVRVKVEPTEHPIIELLESSEDDALPQPSQPKKPSSFIEYTSPGVSSPYWPRVSKSLPISTTTQSSCIVWSLHKVASMPGRKNILKRLDYDNIKTVSKDFLPPQFDGDVLFVLTPVGALAAHSKARSMEGMDKRYDGHMWTRTMTINITNNLNLTFRSSTCFGYLRCENPHCEYLQHSHRALSFNETKFDGFTKEPFLKSGPPPLGSSLVCKMCKEPSKCMSLYKARIFYVYRDHRMQRACIHLGQHQHPVRISDYGEARKKINALIEEQIE